METKSQSAQLLWDLCAPPSPSYGRLLPESPVPKASLLAEICYGRDHAQTPSDPRRVTLGLAELGSEGVAELLWATQDVESGWCGDVGYSRSEDFLFVHLFLDETDPSRLTDLVSESYLRLLGLVRDSGHPHVLRMWNHFPEIHCRYDGIDRYQAFCIGRADAFRRAGLDKGDFPAATAIGCEAPGLALLLLAARYPGTPVENPRQISAYRYPVCYSPQPPAFSRALAFGEPGSRGLLISGTASVVGHRTMHAAQLVPQVHETIRNLSALIAASGLSAGNGQADVPGLLKVFLPVPEYLPAVQGVLDSWTDARARVLYLRGDVCRTDLQIEIEGLYCPPSLNRAEVPRQDSVPAVPGCIQIPTT